MPIKWHDKKARLEFLGLAWITIASLFWLTSRRPPWLPALILLIFIGIGIWAGKNPFRRTPFDFIFVAFLLMASVGVWAAYDREAALDKLWMLVLATVLYYAIAGQPQQNSRLLVGLISVSGVLLSLHFLFYYDWRSLPVDFGIINRVGLSWMAVRPELQGQSLSPNITAGILSSFFPLTLAIGIIAWQRQPGSNRSWLPVYLSICTAGLMALAIFMTSSRGAWFALVSGLGIGFAVVLGEKFLDRQTREWKLAVFLGGITIGVLAIASFFIQISNPARLLDLAPGLSTGQSRLVIDRLTSHLIRDFPFTGGGLGAFAGLFSHYMLVIPNYMFGYSHNLYLDVALEQGLAGLLSLLAILGGSVLLLFRAPAGEDMRPGFKLIRQAALVSLVVMVIHGIVDDSFYGERGTPFVWVVAGLAVFAHPNLRTMADLLPVNINPRRKSKGYQKQLWLAFILIALAVATLGVNSWRQLASQWLANFGAVQMAKVQLVDFPTNKWSVGEPINGLASSHGLFERAILFDPANLTANYRLGLMAMQSQDFQTATDYLIAAYRQDSEHRGVIKNLGYASVWVGDFDRAEALLTAIPEARRELEAYASWWGVQGRPELAQNAEEMVRRMENVNSIHPAALSSRSVIP